MTRRDDLGDSEWIGQAGAVRLSGANDMHLEELARDQVIVHRDEGGRGMCYRVGDMRALAARRTGHLGDALAHAVSYGLRQMVQEELDAGRKPVVIEVPIPMGTVVMNKKADPVYVGTEKPKPELSLDEAVRRAMAELDAIPNQIASLKARATELEQLVQAANRIRDYLSIP